MTMLNDFLSTSATWGVLLTLAAFALGTLINHKTGKAVFNPLLLGTVFVIVFLSVCGIPYASYKASASPVSYLLLPATVSLAVPLYEKWDLLRKNVLAIVMGILAGTLASLGSVLVLSLLLRLDHSQYITLLPKSVTTAISMDVSKELGGIAALTGAIVILTGILAICWPRRSARSATSPTPSPGASVSAPQPTPSAPAKPSRWVKSKAP